MTDAHLQDAARRACAEPSPANRAQLERARARVKAAATFAELPAEERALRELMAAPWAPRFADGGSRGRPEAEANAGRDLVLVRVPAGYQRSDDLIVIALRGTPASGTLLVDLYRQEAVFHGARGAGVVAGDYRRGGAVRRDRWEVVAAFLRARGEIEANETRRG